MVTKAKISKTIPFKLVLSLFLIGCLLPQLAVARQLQPEQYEQLKYRYIGPGGGRLIAAIGVPGDPSTSLVGAASGGIWKTTNYGGRWRPVFDDKEVSSVSALAVSLSSSNEMWAGTGETFLIRPYHGMGEGIFKSTDYGETWEKSGLENTGRIAEIVVHPKNKDIVYACALGDGYSDPTEAGVYKTTDGGKNWKRVLNVDGKAGCSDIDINPKNPDILYAAFWQLKITTWNLNSGGPYSGVYRSINGGKTWKKLSGVGSGLPGTAKEPLGKVAVQVAPSEPQRVYVLTEEPDGPVFYRSDDNGDSWVTVSRNHVLNERAPYYTRFRVDPKDPDRVYFISVAFSLSVDGGKSIGKERAAGGGDNHDMWIDPTNPDRYMVAHDGGLTMTFDHGKSGEGHQLPTAQMYHAFVDNEIPYNVYGNRQDAWSYKGPSRYRGRGIPIGLYEDIGGCESGFSIPDTVDGYTVWSGCYDGGLTVYDSRNKTQKNVRVWPEAAYGWAPKDVDYRWHWTVPLYISPHNHNRVYAGSQYVHVTENKGQSWDIISPDLTKNDKSHQQSSGGVGVDNLYTFDGSTLYAITESVLEKGLIWVGSNDGLVHLTRDNGNNWTNVTKNIKGLPEWATISNIEASWFDAGTAYISVDNHQIEGDFDPYIYMTKDYGKTWKKISNDIPKSVHSFVHVVREDPKKAGALYAGTDNQVYYSPDYGEHWVSLRNNMPPVPIYWLSLQSHFDDLVVGTYGRGFYILDDLSPLRELTAEVMNKNFHLFSFRPTYRFFDISGIKTDGRSHVTGQNPPYGADVNFYLKNNDNAEATVEIFNGDELIRTLTHKTNKGINRVWWDLRYERSSLPKLRTTPPNAKWVEEEMPWVIEGEQGENKWRRLRTWDLDLNLGQLGPRVVPGSYTVKVTVGDNVISRDILIKDDPTSFNSEQDTRDEVKLALAIRDQIDDVVALINEIEWLRLGFERYMDELSKATNDAEKMKILEKVAQLNKRVIEIEGNLFDVTLTGAREDAFRAPMKIYGKLSSLGTDVQLSGGGAPTKQQVKVYDKLRTQFEETRESYNKFIEEELTPFLEELGIENIPVDLENYKIKNE